MYYHNYKSKIKQCQKEIKHTRTKHKRNNLKRKLEKYQRKLEKWQKFRNNKVQSRGCKAKKGNLNLRVVQHESGNVFLRINTARKKDNGRYKKIKVGLYLPRKVNKNGQINGRNYKQLVLEQVKQENAYKVELIRRNGEYYAHITIDEPTPTPKTTEQCGVIGIDTNVDGFALTCIDEEGNYRWHKNFTDYRLYHERTDKRENLCGKLVKKTVEFIKDKGYSVVIEDLEFNQDNYQYGNKTFTRKSHQFVYRKLLSFLERRCKREGVKVKKINPSFTSIIGKYKYQHQFGISVHNAAAMVIARRGLGFEEEKITEYIKENIVYSFVDRDKHEDFFNDYHYWKQWGIINSIIYNLVDNLVQSPSEKGEQLQLSLFDQSSKQRDWSWSRHRKEVLNLAN